MINYEDIRTSHWEEKNDNGFPTIRVQATLHLEAHAEIDIHTQDLVDRVEQESRRYLVEKLYNEIKKTAVELEHEIRRLHFINWNQVEDLTPLLRCLQNAGNHLLEKPNEQV